MSSSIAATAGSTGIMSSSLAIWLLRFILLYASTQLFTRCAPLRGSFLKILIALSVVTPLALSWLLIVTENVPEPYLDEVFHIPQAQVYCRGRYFEWDNKITTPPGLYISTIVFNRLAGFLCSVYDLRAFNVYVVSFISSLALICRSSLAWQSSGRDTDHRISGNDLVTGINVALFPVLFFFSGLYYTDPASTLVVLLAYANHHSRVGTRQPSLGNDVYALVLGILTLGFRQTNIFWVVVYMGGLEIVHVVKALKPQPAETPNFQNVSERARFYAWRYSLGDIHDPSLTLAEPVDIILCVLSISIASIYNLPIILRRFIWPHGVVLASFIGFVAWNGGVVLGDKSNHVATLHLAQLLYIWPFFAFFSAPLFIPQLLRLVRRAYQALTSQDASKRENESIGSLISRALVVCSAIVLGLVIVRLNTIIHPFTLADNRHYVFYVFRYSILKAWWIRYALVPVYVGCAWLCWGALQGSKVPQENSIQSPFTQPTKKTQAQSTSKQSASSTIEAEVELVQAEPPVSTVLMLFLATTLSLMTAPLVEPRYFILPWVFWRLLVPTTFNSSPATKRGAADRSSISLLLMLETAWFVLINAATMYVFVTRPFHWKAPDGTLLDEGRVQRFMW
ncbi:DIE2/ALG10 family-domain-containing protein [Xylaria intraflava]|nr:DIE2/ALG10 family-domain-containing protein [Xylaria intraflava]